MKPFSSGKRRWRSERREEPRGDVLPQKLLGLRLAVVLVFAVLSVQLARLQLVQGSHYEARAQHNQLRMVPVLPARGLIYDRNGKLLVENVPSFAAGVVPADVPEDQQVRVAHDLETMLGVPALETQLRIIDGRRGKDPFAPIIIKDGLDQPTAFRLREAQAQLPGVKVVTEPVRHYSGGSMYSQILGYIGRIDPEEYGRLKDFGYQLNDYVGKSGVEYSYESTLRGTPGVKEVEADATGREIRTLGEIPAKPGKSVVLSVDSDLQRAVTDILRGKVGDDQAAAVVMDVHTGEVLALVSVPDYDNNIFSGPVNDAGVQAVLDNPNKPLLDHAISETYAPGSIFKQVTGLAALQEGVASASTTITSYGYISVHNQYDPSIIYTFKDWAALGTLNFYSGVAQSSDVYFYYLSGGYEGNGQSFQGLGAARLAKWARLFGLGAPTGVDLPSEASGLVPDPDWKQQTYGDPWFIGDTYVFGIGQGYLSVTPLQMARVTAAVANGGDVLQPRIVREVRNADGQVVQPSTAIIQRHLPIDPANLSIMREGMRQAADWGTARSGAIKGVAIAGKTGTAEFGAAHADGSYDTHAWYTCFAPFDNPQIAVTVFLNHGIGATDAGPVAAEILSYYFGRQQRAESGQ